jgi:mannosyl-oligosaccharide glucosidase
MATTDTFYMQPNAEGDNPYWRGPIWVNANYLALSALHYYGSGPGTGPHQDHALRLYRELRRNIMATVVGGFQSTGFFWEQYDDSTGEGMRNRPFSGWTALILNIMSEKY